MVDMIESVTMAIFEEMDLMDGLDINAAQRYAEVAIMAVRKRLGGLMIEVPMAPGVADGVSMALSRLDAALAPAADGEPM